MDVMQLRRGLMMGMANGAEYVKGNFTVPNDSGGSYTLSFGKTFSKYLLLIEADDTSKQTIYDSNVNASHAYAVTAVYPSMQIGDKTAHRYVFNRIHPQTKAISVDGNNNGDLSSTAAVVSVGDLTASSTTNALYRGLTYNYYIVEVK